MVLFITKYKIFLCGLDNSGKTSILNLIKKLPNPGDTSPTIRFQIDYTILEEIEFVIWDAPGQVIYRDRWKDGTTGTQIFCFILDIQSPERFEEAKGVLEDILNEEENANIPLVFCFHKIDIPDGKKNIPQAKDLFNPESMMDRLLHYLETSIMNPDSILKLEELFVKIIENK